MNLNLTIYNQGTALVREQRVFPLKSGENSVDFTDVAATIDRTSVTVRALPDPDAVRVLEQSFLYDLVGLGGLLRRYTDAQIAVTIAEDGTVMNGTLLSGNQFDNFSQNDIILRGGDGQVTAVRLHHVRDIRFPQLPDGLRTRPTLRWILDSAADGDHTLELTYLADGMQWSADYNLLLATNNNSFDLIGWVTLTNESGTTFSDAKIKLVAGDVARIEPQSDRMMMKTERMAFGGAAPAVEQREMFEYQLYEIARRVSLQNAETKQVEFLQKDAVPARIVYQTDSFRLFRGYGDTAYIGRPVNSAPSVNDIEIYAEFTTGDSGVGADMPAGRARVFQNDSDGAAVLVGEAHIKHTPKGENLRLLLGKAFDLVRERKQTDFKLVSKTELTESYEIRLRNRKDSAAVEIQVIERLFRWSNWRIEMASHPYEKIDSGTVRFAVTVPPQGETMLTYTVRYTYPKDAAN